MSVTWGVLSLVIAEIISGLVFSVSTFPRGLNFAFFAVMFGLVFYLGNKIFNQKINSENENPNIANFSRKKLLLVSLVLSVFVVFVRDLFQGTKEIYEASLLMNYVANIFISFATTSYARAKGRNEYWGILGIIGLAVVFFVKPQSTADTKLIKPQVKGVIDFLAIVLLTAALSWTGVYMAYSNLKDEFIKLAWVNQLFLISLLTVVVTTVWALIKNKRHILTIAIWLSLALTLISLFFYSGSYDVRDYYVGARNWFFMCLVLYPFIHLVVHGLAKLSKHDRNVLTPEGIVNYQALTLITAFVWGIYDWIQRAF